MWLIEKEIAIPYLILRSQDHNRRNGKLRIVRKILRDRQNPLDYMEDMEILEKYRLHREMIFSLCNILEGSLKRPTRRSHSLLVLLQICDSLRYFATGSFQAVIGDLHGISRYSVSRAIHSVTSAVCNTMEGKMEVSP